MKIEPNEAMSAGMRSWQEWVGVQGAAAKALDEEYHVRNPEGLAAYFESMTPEQVSSVILPHIRKSLVAGRVSTVKKMVSALGVVKAGAEHFPWVVMRRGIPVVFSAILDEERKTVRYLEQAQLMLEEFMSRPEKPSEDEWNLLLTKVIKMMVGPAAGPFG